MKNAEFYEKKGYGYLIEQKNIKFKLYDLINSIFINQSQIDNILYNQRQYSDKEIYKYLINQLKKLYMKKLI